MKRIPFFSQIEIDLAPEACWIWTGSIASHGYGQLNRDGKKWLAHRYAYTLMVGPIPPGMCVLHECDVRRCCNPEHFFLGTRGDNNRDMALKGRHNNGNTYKTECKRGHSLLGDNVYYYSDGSRECKACRALRGKWIVR